MPVVSLTVPDEAPALSAAVRATVATALDLPEEAVATVVTTGQWSPSAGALGIIHGRDRGPAATAEVLAGIRDCLNRLLAVDPELVHVAWPPTGPHRR